MRPLSLQVLSAKSQKSERLIFWIRQTTRNVLAGLCFYDHATDAQEPYCLARTHHRTGGGSGGRGRGRGRAGGRHTGEEGERALFLCVCLFFFTMFLREKKERNKTWWHWFNKRLVWPLALCSTSHNIITEAFIHHQRKNKSELVYSQRRMTDYYSDALVQMWLITSNGWSSLTNPVRATAKPLSLRLDFQNKSSKRDTWQMVKHCIGRKIDE